MTITKRNHGSTLSSTYPAGYGAKRDKDADFMEEELAEEDLILPPDDHLMKTYTAPTNYVALLAEQAADLAKTAESYQQYQMQLRGIAQKAQEAWVEEQLDGGVPEEESLTKLRELMAILDDAGIETDLNILLDPEVQGGPAA